jgi:hypothetical protein
VPLAPVGLAILKELPRFKGPCVFTTTGGERQISGFSAAKKRADRLITEALAQRAKETGTDLEPMPTLDAARFAPDGANQSVALARPAARR